jgi:hypothetical protein
VATAPYSITASVLGGFGLAEPADDRVGHGDVPVTQDVTLKNLFGTFTGRAVGTTLGSAKRAAPTIANAAVQTYDVDVTAGSTSLRATIGGTSDPAADLDLYVYRCTSDACCSSRPGR